MPSKRYKKLPEKTKDLNTEVIEKLLPEVKKNCTTKFDESLDLSFQINNKQKKSEVNIRTVVNLPGGTGKKIKVAVVCEDNKAQEASCALLSSQTTATLIFFPVPPGKLTTVLILTSLFFCLLFIWKLKSKDSSNLVVQFFLTSGSNFSITSVFRSFVFSGNFLYLFDGIILLPLYPLI